MGAPCIPCALLRLAFLEFLPAPDIQSVTSRGHALSPSSDMFAVVWGKSAKVKGGVANRPSPQSPKGILGSPPPLVQRMQALGQSQSLCFQWAAKRIPGKKALPPPQNYLPPSLINLRYRVMTWTFWAIKALFLLLDFLGNKSSLLTQSLSSAFALTGGRSRPLTPSLAHSCPIPALLFRRSFREPKRECNCIHTKTSHLEFFIRTL